METSPGKSGPDSLATSAGILMRGEAPGLKGISGKLQLQVAETSAGVLQVEPSGAVAIAKDGSSQSVIAVDTHRTLLALLDGELSPIVAALQDRLRVEGDLSLALRVLMGLQGGSRWSETTQRD